MKICVVTLTFGSGGVEHYWDKVMSLEPKINWHVFTQKGALTNLRSHIARAQFFYGLTWKTPFRTSRAFVSYLKTEKPDIVFLNGTLAEAMVFLGLVWARLFLPSLKIKAVFHSTNIYPSKPKSNFNRFLLRLMSITHHANVFVSSFVKAYWGLDGLSLPLPPFVNGGTPQNKKARTVGFLGRLSYEKGPDIFCGLARSFGAGTGAVVAGDGPMKGELAKQFPNVRFLGWVSDTKTFFNDIDILLITSRTEGFGLQAQESLFNGVPVLGLRVGGVEEAMGAPFSEWLSSNESELSKAVCAFLSDYESQYQAYFSQTDRQDAAQKLKAWSTQLLS